MMEISLPNDIIKSHLPHTHSSLFSLLAHTAEQGFSLLTDEILHLAGAMEAAGFRSVVGTMWAMVDDGAPYVAGRFYEEMLKGDADAGQEHIRAARTLWNVSR